MALVRNALGWLLLLGIPLFASWFFRERPSEASAAPPHRAVRTCPEGCRYARYRGPVWDLELSSVEMSTPPFCPIHSKHEAPMGE